MFWQINLYCTSEKGESSWAGAHGAALATSANKVSTAAASSENTHGIIGTRNSLLFPSRVLVEAMSVLLLWL